MRIYEYKITYICTHNGLVGREFTNSPEDGSSIPA